ncbi:MAG TPA: DJ-1/PfpI family protein, partial [Aequorivita sp.]|nr:DJ-1/PfpI family protein [Aequorivita sp.]
KEQLEKDGAILKIIAPTGGTIICDENMEHKVDASIATTESVLFDAVYIPGGNKSIQKLMEEPKYIKFINETLKYCKAISLDGEGEKLFNQTAGKDFKDDKAVLINKKVTAFRKAIAEHRNWDRQKKAEKIPV